MPSSGREIKASATLAAEFLGEYLVQQHAHIAKREKRKRGRKRKIENPVLSQVPPSY